MHDYLEGGIYHPILTVTDLAGDVDTYSRPLDVFTEYCAPSSGGFDQSMTQLSLDGNIIDVSDTSIYDYTDNVISVTAGESLHIIVQGHTGLDSEENWGIWLDINDDGVFDETPQSSELLYNESSLDSENYALDVQVDLPEDLPAGALRLRISGSFSIQKIGRASCRERV